MIQVKNLSKRYGSTDVLRGITTEIKQGEVVAIIGPSGSGKSTFLRCLNLLETPSGGEITVDGVNIVELGSGIAKVRQKMNMVFQAFHLFEHLTVLENLTLAPIQLRGVEKSAAEKRCWSYSAWSGSPRKLRPMPTNSPVARSSVSPLPAASPWSQWWFSSTNRPRPSTPPWSAKYLA